MAEGQHQSVVSSDSEAVKAAARSPLLVAAVTLLTLSFFLLGLAWAFGNPPGGSPDEIATYSKAMGTAFGELRPGPVSPAPPHATGNEIFNAAALGWFTIPQRFFPDERWGCTSTDGEIAAVCLKRPIAPGVVPVYRLKPVPQVVTYVAHYPPIIFGVSGLVARLGGRATDALYLGRLADMTISVAMLLLAFSLSRGRWMLAGVLAAASPMVVFMASSFNPSGVEVASGVAFGVATTVLARRQPTRWDWWAFALSGSVLAVARQFGWVWVVSDLVFLFVLLGPKKFYGLLVAGRFRVRWPVIVVGLFSLSTLLWDVFAEHAVHADLHQAAHNVSAAITQLWTMVDQFVGIFGWANVPLPNVVVHVALVTYACIALAGLVLGRWREKAAWAAFFALGFVETLYMDTALQIPYGFGVQARYVMPLSALLLVYGGSVLDIRIQSLTLHPRARPPGALRRLTLVAVGRVVPLVLSAAYVGLQFEAWLQNSHDSAVGLHGSWDFFTRSSWAPRTGWTVLLVMAALGTLLALAGAVLFSVRSPAGLAAPTVPTRVRVGGTSDTPTAPEPEPEPLRG
ncbi:MAG TPA: DUF2142 domain-containing protein [Acidimicrobiales bacterium]|nr:DUF2142 domain-containing protein [Acidimicrobiales bacterium]